MAHFAVCLVVLAGAEASGSSSDSAEVSAAEATKADPPRDSAGDEKKPLAVGPKAVAALRAMGGLPLEIVHENGPAALQSDEFGELCEKQLVEVLAEHGISARRAKKKTEPLQLTVKVSGSEVDRASVASGMRYTITLTAQATLRHRTVALRRFTVKSRYTRGSVERALGFAMRHAAKEIGPKLIDALNAWAKH